jgi:hypothetical protein
MKLFAVAGLGLGLAGSSAQAELIYGLTTDNNIFSFDSATPGTILSGHYVTGLAANESLVGMDFRPATGALYAVSTFGTLYTINPTTGAVTSGVPITGAVLNGTSFDIDFNPVADAIRLVSDADQNLAINPVTGAATVQSNINAGYGNPNLSGAAYTNNFAGAGSTTLYTIDTGFSSVSGGDLLNIQNTPASGTQTASLGLTDGNNTTADLTGLLGFDISGSTGSAFLALQYGVNGYSQFSTLNLGTAKINNASVAFPSSGLIGSGLFVRDISVLPVPEPTSLAALGVAGLSLLARRRKA